MVIVFIILMARSGMSSVYVKKSGLSRKYDWLHSPDSFRRPDDSNDLSKQIGRYFSMSAEQRIIIGQNARRTVENRFSLKAMVTNFESLYDSITVAGNLK